MTAFVIFAYSAELVAVKRWRLVAMTKSGRAVAPRERREQARRAVRCMVAVGCWGMWD